MLVLYGAVMKQARTHVLESSALTHTNKSNGSNLDCSVEADGEVRVP